MLSSALLYSIPEVYYEDGAHWFDLQLILFVNLTLFTSHRTLCSGMYYSLLLRESNMHLSQLQWTILFAAYSKNGTIQESLYYCTDDISIQMCVCKTCAQSCLTSWGTLEHHDKLQPPALMCQNSIATVAEESAAVTACEGKPRCTISIDYKSDCITADSPALITHQTKTLDWFLFHVSFPNYLNA